MIDNTLSLDESFKKKIQIVGKILILNEENILQIQEDIVSFIGKNEDRVNYFYHLLFYLLKIFPKKSENFASLLHFLLYQYGKRFKIINLATKNAKFKHILYLLYRKDVINDKEFREISPKDVITKKQIELYSKGTIERIIYEDDLEQLQILLNNPNHNVLNIPIKNESSYPITLITEENSISILSFCSFYGAIRSLKYLILNEFKLEENNCPFAVAGGNNEIIHILENQNFHFYSCSKICVIFHQNSIFDWLLQHYQIENTDLLTCLHAFNDEAFFYFLKTNQLNDFTLIEACQQENYEIVVSHINNKVNLNIGAYKVLFYTFILLH